MIAPTFSRWQVLSLRGRSGRLLERSGKSFWLMKKSNDFTGWISNGFVATSTGITAGMKRGEIESCARHKKLIGRHVLYGAKNSIIKRDYDEAVLADADENIKSQLGRN